jgi:hypothetical protein
MALALWAATLAPHQHYQSRQSERTASDRCTTPECRAEVANEIVAHYTRTLAAFTGALAFVGIVGTIVSFVQIRFLIRADQRTEETISLARIEFEAEHRPWLAVRDMLPDEGDGITIGSDVWVPVKIVIENAGSAPALGFFAYLDGFEFGRRSPKIDPVLQEQAQRFDREKGTPAVGDKLPFGVVFPKDSTEHTDIIDVPVERLKGEGKQSKVISLNMMIIGSLFYRSPHDDADHCTTFVYKMALKGGANRVSPNLLDGYDEIPPENFKFTKLHLGWTAT